MPQLPTFHGQCRYCLDTDDGLIAPCEGIGSAHLVHRECLARWQKRKSHTSRTCEVCKEEWLVQLDVLDRECFTHSVRTIVQLDVQLDQSSLSRDRLRRARRCRTCPAPRADAARHPHFAKRGDDSGNPAPPSQSHAPRSRGRTRARTLSSAITRSRCSHRCLRSSARSIGTVVLTSS